MALSDDKLKEMREVISSSPTRSLERRSIKDRFLDIGRSSVGSLYPNLVVGLSQSLGTKAGRQEFGEQMGQGFLGTKAGVQSGLGKIQQKIPIPSIRKSGEDLLQIAERNQRLKQVLELDDIKIDDEARFVDKLRDPNYLAKMIGGNLPNLAAGMGLAVPAALLGGPALGVAAGLTSTGILEGGMAYQEAKQFGATEKEAEKAAFLTGLANSLLEVVPLGTFFKSVGTPARNAFLKTFATLVTQAISEGATESLQEIMANAAARTYDENRDLFEGVPEAGFFGALTGGGLGFSGVIVTEGGRRVIKQYESLTPAQRQAGFIDLSGLTPENRARTFDTVEEFIADEQTRDFPQINIPNRPEPLQITNITDNTVETADGQVIAADVFEQLSGISTQLLESQLQTAKNNLQQRIKEAGGKEQFEKVLKDIYNESKTTEPQTLEELSTQEITDVEQPADLVQPDQQEVLTEEQTRERKAQVPQEVKDITKKDRGPFIRQREYTLLKNRVRDIARGYREGTRFTKQQVADVQNDLINLVEQSDVTLKDKGKFLRTVKNINTPQKLQKALPGLLERIDRLTLSETQRAARSQIKKLLKQSKPKTQAGKKVGKLTPEKQQTVEAIRSVVKLNATDRAELKQKILSRFTSTPGVDESMQLEAIGMVERGEYTKLLAILEDAVTTGKAQNKFKTLVRKQNNEARVKKFFDLITGGKPLPARPDSKAYNRNFKNKLRRVFAVGSSMFHLQNLLDVFSSEDKTSKPLQSDLNKFGNFQKQISKEKEYTEVAVLKVHEAIERIFKPKSWLGRNYAIGRKIRMDSRQESLGTFTDSFGEKVELELSRSEARKRWMELKDETIDWEAQGYTQEMRDAIDEYLTDQDKEFAQWQLDFYRYYYYPRVNRVYRRIYHVDLPFHEFYSPIRREGFKWGDFSGFGEFLQEQFTRQSIANNSTKRRTKNNYRVKEQSDYMVMANYIAMMEHFITHAEKVRNVDDALRSPEIKRAIVTKYGNKAYQHLTDFLDDITAGAMTKAKMNEKIEKLATAMATGSLGFNPVIMMKQFTSFIAGAEAIPVKDWMRYEAEFLADPVGKTKFLLDNSADLRTRGSNVTRDMIRSPQRARGKLIAGDGLFTESSGLTIKAGDKGAIIAGYYPVYKYHYVKNKQSGMSEKQAHREAITTFESVYNLVQQTPHIQGLSSWQRGGTFTRLFTMFLSSLNLYMQKEIIAVRGVLTGREKLGQAVKTLVMYHVILPNLFLLVGNLFDEDKIDEEEHALATLLGPLSGIFVVGDIVESIVRRGANAAGFDIPVWDNELPLYRMVQEVEQLIDTLDEPTLRDVTFAITQLGETMPGVAAVSALASQTIAGVEGIEDLINGDTREGIGLLLGYSHYSVGKGGRKKKSTTSNTGRSIYAEMRSSLRPDIGQLRPDTSSVRSGYRRPDPAEMRAAIGR